jgi:hypothetical protein
MRLKRIGKAHKKCDCSGSVFTIQAINVSSGMPVFKEYYHTCHINGESISRIANAKTEDVSI